MVRDSDQYGFSSTRFRDERMRSGPHPMFAELGRIDQDYNRRYWDMSERQARSEAENTVRQYAEEMSKYPGDINPKVLCDRSNRMSGNIDPVFVVLARTIGGRGAITPETWNRMTDEWCTSDLPRDLYRVLTAPDQDFVRGFQGFRFDPSDNVKFIALQKTGIVRQLVEPRRI